MNKMKKLLAVLLCFVMVFALAACGETEPGDVDINDEEAWKAEPAYGQTIRYWLSDGCTSGPAVADELGYFEEMGLTAEPVKGTSYTEALGTGSAEVAVGHIATMLVPSTNSVDLTFVGASHVGCKSIYVLADSNYNSTADLKGTTISVPNGIGASDYNITACLLDSDGINPLEDVELKQVETSACVAAMQRGEISAALLSDTFAYNMVKDGTLKQIRSLLDEDWAGTPCCVVAMNASFVKENPITASRIAAAVQKAHEWMGANPKDATDLLIKMGLNSEDVELNTQINTQLAFGSLDNTEAEAGLKKVAEAYIKLGIITSMDNVDDVMEVAWTPLNNK